MERPIAFAIGVAALAFLLRAAAGCQGGGSPQCQAGCNCFAVETCPAVCYVSQEEQPDGSTVTFCSNSVEQCVADGGAWSVSTSLNGCESGTARPVDGGPAGAVCCAD